MSDSPDQKKPAQKTKFKIRSLLAPTRVLSFDDVPTMGELQQAVQNKFAAQQEELKACSLWYRDNEFEDLQIIDQSDLEACVDEARILQGLTEGAGQLRVVLYLLEKTQTVEQVLGHGSFDDETFLSCAQSTGNQSQGFVMMDGGLDLDCLDTKSADNSFAEDLNTANQEYARADVMHETRRPDEDREDASEKLETMIFEILTLTDKNELAAKYPKFATLCLNASDSQSDLITKLIPAFKTEAPTITQLEPKVVQPANKIPEAVPAPKQPIKPKAPAQKLPERRHPAPRHGNAAGYDIIKGFFDGVSAAITSLGSIEFACDSHQ